MRKIYMTEIEKIDYAFLDKDLQTIQFEIFQTYPIIKDEIIMDINTIQKFRSAIDEMFELKKKKEELRMKKKNKTLDGDKFSHKHNFILKNSIYYCDQCNKTINETWIEEENKKNEKN